MIRALKSHFARWWNLSTIVRNNGSQYTADKFREFTAKWDIEHWTGAPGHANANGKAESSVKAAKHRMEECKRRQTDPLMATLEISNSPTQGAGSTAHIKLKHSPTIRANYNTTTDRGTDVYLCWRKEISFD